MRRRYRKLRRRKHKSLMRNTIIIMFVLTLGIATGYSAFQTNISINAKGNIKEKSRVIRSWTSDSVDDFHNSQYREIIVSATFLDSTSLPSNVENSWDVSADGKGGVIAYVMINEEDHTKYDLYIGAKNGVIANENSADLFSNFTAVKHINFNDNFDTTTVITMLRMFYHCTKLIDADVSNFNTANVTNMQNMFDGCNNLVELDVHNFITTNVVKMGAMFWCCYKLDKINVSNFNIENVDDINGMFGNCNSLSSINTGNFKNKKVKNMSQMFLRYYALETIDLSSFVTTQVTDMHGMFDGCNNLQTIYVSDSFDVSNVTNSSAMFHNTLKLVGQNGTVFSWNYVDKTYARIDTSSTPGYFTLKQS